MDGKIIEIRGPFHEWNPPHTVFCAWQLRVRYRVDKREIWLATHCHPAKKRMRRGLLHWGMDTRRGWDSGGSAGASPRLSE
ncbi:hypothetical protein CLIM01_06878 [Colletotrichum limetticola]|uniref:Uncharacterized protein n=1 Tax=Colletotrichum limetticola TaxID=1209924 RepID=A0ABQ9PW73_9PEZI|nr:hypothetical protein CLIM01_06878 [Colletotrichum limetticola]